MLPNCREFLLRGNRLCRVGRDLFWDLRDQDRTLEVTKTQILALADEGKLAWEKLPGGMEELTLTAEGAEALKESV